MSSFTCLRLLVLLGQVDALHIDKLFQNCNAPGSGCLIILLFCLIFQFFKEETIILCLKSQDPDPQRSKKARSGSVTVVQNAKNNSTYFYVKNISSVLVSFNFVFFYVFPDFVWARSSS